MGRKGEIERSISIGPVQPEKVVNLKRYDQQNLRYKQLKKQKN